MSRSGGQVAAASSSSRSASAAAGSAAAPWSEALCSRLEKIRMPCASPARSPAPSISAVSSGRVNRRAAPVPAGAPGAPSGYFH